VILVPDGTSRGAEPGIWATKPAEDMIAESHERGSELKRAIGVLDLTVRTFEYAGSRPGSGRILARSRC
jgi:hypothetical protein